MESGYSMKLIGLFGHPVEHSLSPAMHNYAFEQLGLQYKYFAFDVEPHRIAQAIDAIRALNIVGVNVTIPFKEIVVPYLDKIDESASNIKAVNTIVNNNGYLIGYNTDGEGYVTSLELEMDINVNEMDITVIGAGGAARGIIYSLLSKGCKSVTIINRNISKARIIADDFRNIGNISISCDEVSTIHNTDIIINTTPVGMFPNVNDLPINASHISSKQIVSDIVYNPYETQLLKEARQKGAKIHSGLGMFVHQGSIAFKKWTGHNPPIDEMYQYIKKLLIK
jgi:shikimate dehydrogenase